nr:putative HNHc nuclease [uncultured Azospirillum sp.]
MALPARIKRDTAGTGREKRARSSAHLKFVRSHQCSVPGCKGMPIEAAHVRTGTDGGIGMKPSDNWTISLCREHHQEQHAIGEPAFETRHRIDMKALAREFAAASPAWKRHLQKTEAQR